MLDFGAIPPEINSGLMYTGPGSGPLMAAAAGVGWGGSRSWVPLNVWLQFGHLGADQRAMGRAFIVCDDFSGHAVRVLAGAWLGGPGRGRPPATVDRRCRGL